VRRVLLVEDDPVVLRLCQTVLERQDYRVVAAVDANEALTRALPAAELDLALVDIMLPGRSGVQLVERLRADGMTAPVICMSGYPASDLPVLSCAAFLPKPFTPNQLLSLVRQLLQ
jgi:two-component system, OmpR family, response regulator